MSWKIIVKFVVKQGLSHIYIYIYHKCETQHTFLFLQLKFLLSNEPRVIFLPLYQAMYQRKKKRYLKFKLQAWGLWRQARTELALSLNLTPSFLPSFPFLYPPSSLLFFKLEGVDYPCPCGRTSPYATFQPVMKVAKNRHARWVIISKWHNCLTYCMHCLANTLVKNVPSHQGKLIHTHVTQRPVQIPVLIVARII